jgi:drug/metabolite transporter (DMT)-like permease
MSILFALGSALSYGVADFLGGFFSKRTSVWALTFVVQLVGCTFILAVALFLPGEPSRSDFLWGGLGGIANGIGTAALYRGLATGSMSVVAPISGVGAALVPVAIGVGLGERPTVIVWLGVLIALPAIWLVAREPADSAQPDGGSGVRDGVLAGLGFGLLFASIDQISPDAGWLPLAFNEAIAGLVIAVVATAVGARWIPTRRADWAGAASGVLVGLATGLFLLATQTGLLTVAAVLSSLYPAFTIILAAIVLKERVHGARLIGLALSVVAVGLVVAG